MINKTLTVSVMKSYGNGCPEKHIYAQSYCSPIARLRRQQGISARKYTIRENFCLQNAQLSPQDFINFQPNPTVKWAINEVLLHNMESNM